MNYKLEVEALMLSHGSTLVFVMIVEEVVANKL